VTRKIGTEESPMTEAGIESKHRRGGGGAVKPPYRTVPPWTILRAGSMKASGLTRLAEVRGMGFQPVSHKRQARCLSHVSRLWKDRAIPDLD
jgi:hypothetical protein